MTTKVKQKMARVYIYVLDLLFSLIFALYYFIVIFASLLWRIGRSRGMVFREGFLYRWVARVGWGGVFHD